MASNEVFSTFIKNLINTKGSLGEREGHYNFSIGDRGEDIIKEVCVDFVKVNQIFSDHNYEKGTKHTRILEHAIPLACFSITFNKSVK